MSGHDTHKKNPNKLEDSGVFFSKRSINRFPQKASDTLFFTATSYDWDAKQPREEAEGLGENFLRVHEIGRRDCALVKYPDIPLLTRKSQSYTLQFPPKQATDLEVNRYAAELKKMGTAGKGPKLELAAKSSYGETFVRSSPSEMRRARPAPVFSSATPSAKPQKSIVRRSHSQTVHGGDHSGFKASGEAFHPIHELEVDNGCPLDFWQSRGHLEFADHSRRTGYKGQSVRWRKRHGTKLVDRFLDDMGDSLRRINSAPSVTMLKPVNFIGVELEGPSP
eukprot:gb/GFBE01061325.1/.p1 GENE.gb/GFBE01061325.1/~~gb/GFBE01061325.1/.p1  ORF type:complete len:279 (+),score=42.05 gb/GFBE01061325.1/:1-837(+)